MATAEGDALMAMWSRAIGRPLRRVAAAVYALNGKLYGEASELWLYFEELPPLHLRGDRDGWHLRADASYPEPIDAEEMGEIVVRDITLQSVFRAVRGQPLCQAWLVESSLDEGPVGVRLDFGAFVRPIIMNLGDQLYVSHRYPTDIYVGEEYLEIPILTV